MFYVAGIPYLLNMARHVSLDVQFIQTIDAEQSMRHFILREKRTIRISRFLVKRMHCMCLLMTQLLIQ